MRFNIILILILVLAQGCRRAPENYVPVQFDKEVAAQWQSLNPDLEISDPLAMAADSSGIYIISIMGSHSIHRFSKTDGARVFDFGSLGMGPEDFLTPFNCLLDNGIISAYDMIDKSIKIVKTDGTFIKKVSLPREEDINEAFMVDSSSILGLGRDRKLTVYADGKPTTVYDALPTGFDKINEWYDLKTRSTLTDNRFFYATLLGGFLESFEVKQDTIILTKRLHIPNCEVLFNSSGQVDDSSITYGFNALCAGNGYCIGAFSGTTDPNVPSKIGIWDYNLEPIICLATDKRVMCLCVDGNMLYALTHTSATGYGLECIDLSKYL